jgi:hypothetical protein
VRSLLRSLSLAASMRLLCARIATMVCSQSVSASSLHTATSSSGRVIGVSPREEFVTVVVTGREYEVVVRPKRNYGLLTICFGQLVRGMDSTRWPVRRAGI